jgi:hypothetical protein
LLAPLSAAEAPAEGALLPSIVIGPAPPIVLERVEDEVEPLLIESVLFDEVPGPGALALPDGDADCEPVLLL